MQTPLHRIFVICLAVSTAWSDDAVDSSAQPPSSPPATDTAAADTTDHGREAVLDAQEVRSTRSAAPNPRRVIGREELSRSGSLAALLSQEPGLSVQRTGGLGGISRVSMRGSPSEQVEVLLDGRPLGGSTGSAVDLGPIPLDGLERVEIVQAGSDGASTAPRIELHSRQGWSRAGASVRAGSFGERAASGWWGDSAGRVTLTGWIESADNDYEVPWDNGTRYNTRDDRVVELENNQYLGRGLAASLRPTQTFDLHLRADDSRRGVSAPGWEDPHASLEGTSVSGGARWRDDARTFRPEASLSGRWFRSEWKDPDALAGYDVDKGSVEEALDGTVAARMRREESDWRDGWLGADLRMERSERRSTGSAELAVTPSGERRTIGAEAGWSGRNPSSRVGFEASARGEWMRDVRDWTEDLGDVAEGEDIESSWSGARFAGRMWVRPVEGWSLWVSGARRIRPPDFREWMGDNGFTLRTPDLEVERSLAGEFGNRLALGPFDGSAVAWISSYEDPIESFQRGASPLVAHRNAPGFVAQGLDARLSVDAHVARLSAGGTLQRAWIEDPNPSMDGNLPRRFPAWKASASAASAPVHGVSAGADVELQGETYASELNRPTDLRDGRVFLGTWLRWRLGGFATLLSLRNLLDEHPEDFEDIPLAGRQFSLRLDYELPGHHTHKGALP